MSFAAIVTGLLVWLSLPAFLKGRLAPGTFAVVRPAAKWAGICIIAGGIIYGL